MSHLVAVDPQFTTGHGCLAKIAVDIFPFPKLKCGEKKFRQRSDLEKVRVEHAAHCSSLQQMGALPV